MLAFLAQIFGGPLLNSLIGGALSAYKAKLAAGNTQESIAADLAARELTVQTAEIQAQTQLRIAEIGHWYQPDVMMGYCVAFLLGKIIVWDTCLGLGSTDLHQGWMTTTSNLIVSFYFGKRTFENVARIIKR